MEIKYSKDQGFDGVCVYSGGIALCGVSYTTHGYFDLGEFHKWIFQTFDSVADWGLDGTALEVYIRVVGFRLFGFNFQFALPNGRTEFWQQGIQYRLDQTNLMLRIRTPEEEARLRDEWQIEKKGRRDDGTGESTQ